MVSMYVIKTCPVFSKTFKSISVILILFSFFISFEQINHQKSCEQASKPSEPKISLREQKCSKKHFKGMINPRRAFVIQPQAQHNHKIYIWICVRIAKLPFKGTVS